MVSKAPPPDGQDLLGRGQQPDVVDPTAGSALCIAARDGQEAPSSCFGLQQLGGATPQNRSDEPTLTCLSSDSHFVFEVHVFSCPSFGTYAVTCMCERELLLAM